jgi:L-rhamnose-H+ transport protein
MAEHYGAGVWKGNVSYIFVNSGAFVTAALYSLYLARRNRTLSQLVTLPSETGSRGVGRNHLLAMLTGTLWYGQFFFYNLGHVYLGTQYAFCSWAIHMIMLVLFSNLLAIVFKEWKGSAGRTRLTIGVGIVVLAAAIIMLTFGNHLGGVI